jgi:putative membrane-bound dehydrogenase-like protein
MRRFSTLTGAWLVLWFLVAVNAKAQLSPQDSLKTLKPAEGLEVSLFASEPMITNPSCMDVDTQGRVWVAEIQFYRKAAKQPAEDKIKVLEDTDGDGKADKVTVFADDVFAPMSLCVCGDKVYAFVQGDLLVWEDKNGDLVADGPPKKLLTGFAKDNHDHTAHSMVVGPDHKWYMAHGDTGFDVIGTDGSKIAYRFGAMIRGEMDGSKLETTAVNFRNPYEICVNSFGESFCSDNDDDGNESVRICWILEGGNYGWSGRPPFKRQELDRRVPKSAPYREAWHFRGYVPGYVPGTLVTGFGSPTGMCIYESDVLPQFKNMPLHTDAGPRVLRAYPHKPHGYGMQAESIDWLTNEGDNNFRPDDVCVAPDGSLLISDWYDGGVGGHAYNNPEQGRIYLVKPVGQKLTRSDKPGPYTTVADAIAGLKSPNLDTQFLAREKLLAEGQGSVPALKALLADSEPNNRARAMWVLDRIGGAGSEAVVDQLSSDDAALRALAVRIVRRHGKEYASQILSMVDDTSAEVRREVLLACGTFPAEPLAFNTLVKLAAECDGTDRYLLEAVNIAVGDRKELLYAALTSSDRDVCAMLPLLQLLNPKAASEYIIAELKRSQSSAKKLRALVASAAKIPAVEAGRAVLAVLADDAVDAEVRGLALEALTANLDTTWAALAEDPHSIDVYRRLLTQNPLRLPVLSAIASLRMKGLAADVLQMAETEDSDVAIRCQALETLMAIPEFTAGTALQRLLNDKNSQVRDKALQALADRRDFKTLKKVLADDQVAVDLKKEVCKRLMESDGGPLALRQMLEHSTAMEAVQQDVIAAAVIHPDANVRTLFEKYIPEDQRPKKLGGTIKPEDILALSGDAKRGESIFKLSTAAQCKNCHRVNNAGGDVGPDLSNIGSKYEKAALLETILDPSKAISHEYKSAMVETVNGQVFVGIVVQNNNVRVVLKDINGKLIRIKTADVETLKEVPKSLMPDLVLQEVSAQDAADLLAYMMTLNKNGKP